MKKIIKISDIMESESTSKDSYDDKIDNILSSFKIENMKQTVSKNDISYFLNFNTNSRIYYMKDLTSDSLICFIKSTDGKFTLLNHSELIENISKKLNTGESFYKVRRGTNDDNSFSIIIMRDLVHEIALYCEDILLELKDIGFGIRTTVTSQKSRTGEIASYIPPSKISFIISRNKKFKYSPDEEEKPIFYKTSRGFDIVSLADYIDSLADYLASIGYGPCREMYHYGSDITLSFELKKHEVSKSNGKIITNMLSSRVPEDLPEDYEVDEDDLGGYYGDDEDDDDGDDEDILRQYQ